MPIRYSGANKCLQLPLFRTENCLGTSRLFRRRIHYGLFIRLVVISFNFRRIINWVRKLNILKNSIIDFVRHQKQTKAISCFGNRCPYQLSGPLWRRQSTGGSDHFVCGKHIRKCYLIDLICAGTVRETGYVSSCECESSQLQSG